MLKTTLRIDGGAARLLLPYAHKTVIADHPGTEDTTVKSLMNAGTDNMSLR